MKIGLVVTVYNRPEEFRQCLDSLSEVDMPSDFVVVIVDDSSTDESIREIAHQLKGRGDMIYVRNQHNMGIKESLKRGCTICWTCGCEMVVNLDGDAIVKPEFIKRLLELKARFPDSIVSGFNTKVQNRNPIIEEHEDYLLKKYASGINMCFTQSQYDSWFAPALRRPGNWDYNVSLQCVEEGVPVVYTKPSVVQHIGLTSTMGHTEQPDVACDFVQLELPRVTLFGIAYNDPQGMKRAADISTRDIKFAREVIMTNKLFEGREGYSRFCIRELTKYFDTDFVLKIEPDGYVQNVRAWTDEFMEYDYIGATWGYKDNRNVGNGGFSMRSKKLQDILASDENITIFHPEDHSICRVYRDYLEDKYGIRYAPEELANRFSIEAFGVPPQFIEGAKYSGQFGFHGFHVQGLPVPPIRLNLNNGRSNNRAVKLRPIGAGATRSGRR